ncbi:unnamed protein product [Spirodela intermedia]|uniref:Uncharacterized protein n=1 Tax=Spirodela intermedia TaxID=51605 RepID=A0ABN7E9N0_SPIIN|nr:unnamed protein product [Spirodela intermedia]
MGRRIVFGGCHPVERKNGDFATLWRLSPDGEELDGGGAHVRELHPQVCVARGGSSSHLVRSQEVATLQEEECKTKWKIKNEVEKSLIWKKKEREQWADNRNLKSASLIWIVPLYPFTLNPFCCTRCKIEKHYLEVDIKPCILRVVSLIFNRVFIIFFFDL